MGSSTSQQRRVWAASPVLCYGNAHHKGQVMRKAFPSLQWRHNGHDSVSNHQPHDCLFNRLFRRRSKKTSKLRVAGLCAGNSPGTGEFPAQMASNAENVSIWWRHHDVMILSCSVSVIRTSEDCDWGGYIGSGPYLLIYFLWWCQYMYT